MITTLLVLDNGTSRIKYRVDAVCNGSPVMCYATTKYVNKGKSLNKGGQSCRPAGN